MLAAMVVAIQNHTFYKHNFLTTIALGNRFTAKKTSNYSWQTYFSRCPPNPVTDLISVSCHGLFISGYLYTVLI